MRQEVAERLKVLLKERRIGSWKDGWVYGRLKEEFDLQPDELEELVTALGFKRGWNPAVKEILENQWQQEEIRWMKQHLAVAQKQASLKRQKEDISKKIDTLLQEINSQDPLPREMTDIEQVLISLILRMNAEEQVWILETILSRYKF